MHLLLLEIKATVCVGLSDAYLDHSFFEISSSGFRSLSLCAVFMFLTHVASHSTRAFLCRVIPSLFTV